MNTETEKLMENVQNILDKVEEIKRWAAPIGKAIVELKSAELKNQKSRVHISTAIDEDDISIKHGCIYVNYEESCCGEWEEHQEEIPLEYLFDPDFLEKAKEKIRQEKLEQQRKEQLEQELGRKRQEAQEREQYLKLKEKFER